MLLSLDMMTTNFQQLISDKQACQIAIYSCKSIWKFWEHNKPILWHAWCGCRYGDSNNAFKNYEYICIIHRIVKKFQNSVSYISSKLEMVK